MRSARLWRTLLTMMCCAVACRAQHTVTVPEQLQDKSWLIQINGEMLKCINADKVRELQQTKLDLDECRERLRLTESQVQRLLETSQSWHKAHDNLSQQLATVRAERDAWAQQAEALAEAMPARPNGKIATLLAKPAAQLGFALLPVIVRGIWR